MSDEMVMLAHRIDERTDLIATDLRELKVRMTGLVDGFAAVNDRLDRLDVRLERIERRLGTTGT